MKLLFSLFIISISLLSGYAATNSIPESTGLLLSRNVTYIGLSNKVWALECSYKRTYLAAKHLPIIPQSSMDKMSDLSWQIRSVKEEMNRIELIVKKLNNPNCSTCASRLTRFTNGRKSPVSR